MTLSAASACSAKAQAAADKYKSPEDMAKDHMAGGLGGFVAGYALGQGAVGAAGGGAWGEVIADFFAGGTTKRSLYTLVYRGCMNGK
jgi:hypothetical protein